MIIFLTLYFWVCINLFFCRSTYWPSFLSVVRRILTHFFAYCVPNYQTNKKSRHHWKVDFIYFVCPNRIEAKVSCTFSTKTKNVYRKKPGIIQLFCLFRIAREFHLVKVTLFTMDQFEIFFHQCSKMQIIPIKNLTFKLVFSNFFGFSDWNVDLKVR